MNKRLTNSKLKKNDQILDEIMDLQDNAGIDFLMYPFGLTPKEIEQEWKEYFSHIRKIKKLASRLAE